MTVMTSVAAHEPARSVAAPGEQDGANFRLAMREFATGVAIVACGAGETLGGCTASAVSSLSLTPPSLIVCLDQKSSTLAALRRAGAFSVNFLAARHLELAHRFAGRGGFQGAERFAQGDWATLATGAPTLADAAAVIDCELDEILERHTHAVLFGLVAAVRLNDASPALLHWRGKFETLG